ncbi:MAG: type II toxin-antitoxin system RatA family toxin, partial [bacterium]
MIKVEDTRIIRAPIQKVFQLVSRLEAQPHVTGLWFSADLIDRRQNTATVLYKGYFGGIPLESVQRATLYPPQRVEFKQSRGGLKAFAGRYSLKPIDGETELSMQIEAEVGIALITEASARRVLYAYVERSLQKIKFLAERDLPRPVRRVVEDAAPSTSATPPTTEAGPLGPSHEGA